MVALLEPGAPPWAQRLVLRLQDVFAPLVPKSPVRLPAFASTSLPAPADWRGCIIYVPDKGKVARSDGTAWTDAIGGVL